MCAGARVCVCVCVCVCVRLEQSLWTRFCALQILLLLVVVVSVELGPRGRGLDVKISCVPVSTTLPS